MQQGRLKPALTCSFSGADDGIRTRDPHLGKVPGAGSLTCDVAPILPVSSGFSFACNVVVSRRFSIVDGTPTGPLVYVLSETGCDGDRLAVDAHVGGRGVPRGRQRAKSRRSSWRSPSATRSSWWAAEDRWP